MAILGQPISKKIAHFFGGQLGAPDTLSFVTRPHPNKSQPAYCGTSTGEDVVLTASDPKAVPVERETPVRSYAKMGRLEMKSRK